MTTRKKTLKRNTNKSRLSLWFIRKFKVISKERAIELGLSFWRNLYGSEIKNRNCRSLWIDNNKSIYRVADLENDSEI